MQTGYGILFMIKNEGGISLTDSKRVLMVVTNHTKITDDHQTGLWLEEFAVPYLVFREKGYEVTVASIQGGRVPLDPNSIGDKKEAWEKAEKELEHTKSVEEVKDETFDAVFLPGGHGTMFDFPNNETLQYILREHAEKGKVIAAVCHGPSGLVHVTLRDGTPLVKGKTVTSFTDSEEKEMKLDADMPFLLETKLREKGADFAHGDNWQDFSVRDGQLVTGQNPQSSRSTAEKVVEALESA